MYVGCCAYNPHLGDASVGATAAAGATVGSVVPGIGTAIGGIVGAVVGAVLPLFGPKNTAWTPATCAPAGVNAKVGPDGWWYDLTDGHQLTHTEASQRCAQLGVANTMQPTTPGISVANVALLAGIGLTGFLLVRAIAKRR